MAVYGLLMVLYKLVPSLPKPVKCDLDISISIALILYINFATMLIFCNVISVIQERDFFHFLVSSVAVF